MTEEMSSDLVELTAEIVSAFVTNNNVSAADLPALIQATHKALAGTTAVAPEPAPTPAISIRKSITPDFLISLEDGKSYKSLKRHLSGFGLTPDEYRAKWGLPKDYPMVAPNYSAQRSSLAKTLGLGRKAAPAPVAAKAVGKTAKAAAKPAPEAKAKPGPKPRGKAIKPSEDTFT